MSEYITMRDCLKLDLKDAQQRLREMEDQRDFAMSEMERLKRERDMAREKLSHAQALLAEMQDALKLAVNQLLKQ